MPRRAPRPPSRLWPRSARGAWQILSMWLAASAPGAGLAQQIAAAEYADPTTRYAHGVLGDAVEWGTLQLTLSDGRGLRVVLPETLVFEDTAPRLADLDGDAAPEVIVVESSLSQGARLAVYDRSGRIAATPFIGQSHRWLAPVGAADLDGDGNVEIAYIDRPHLAKTLRIWRYRNGNLTEVARQTGLSNHQIGWDHIPGGVRKCGPAPELITASGDWSRTVASTLQGGRITTRDIGPFTGPDSLNSALGCP